MRKYFSLLLCGLLLFSSVGCGAITSTENVSSDSSEKENINVSIEFQDTKSDSDRWEDLFQDGSTLTQQEIEDGKSLVENSTTIFEKLPKGLVIEKEFIVGNFAEAGDLQFNSFDMFSSNEIEFAYVIRNNSGKDVAYQAHVKCIDKDGEDIGVSRNYLPTIPNKEAYIFFSDIALDADEVAKIDHLEVSIYEDTDEDISMSHEISFLAEENPCEVYPLDYMDLDITVTNNSKYDADVLYMVIIIYNPVDHSIIDIKHTGWSASYDSEEENTALKAGSTGFVDFQMYDIDDKESGKYENDAEYWKEYDYFLDYELYPYSYRPLSEQ